MTQHSLPNLLPLLCLSHSVFFLLGTVLVMLAWIVTESWLQGWCFCCCWLLSLKLRFDQVHNACILAVHYIPCAFCLFHMINYFVSLFLCLGLLIPSPWLTYFLSFYFEESLSTILLGLTRPPSSNTVWGLIACFIFSLHILNYGLMDVNFQYVWYSHVKLYLNMIVSVKSWFEQKVKKDQKKKNKDFF